MIGNARRALVAVATTACALLLCASSALATQYVVEVDDAASAAKVARTAGVQPDAVFNTAISGFVADLSNADLNKLERDPRVVDVREDSPITTLPFRRSPLESDPFRRSPFEPDPFRRSPFESSPFRRSILEWDPFRRSILESDPFRRSPFEEHPFRRSPFRRSPFRRSPFRRSPFRRSPFRRSPFRRSPADASPADYFIDVFQWIWTGPQRVGALDSPTANVDGVDDRVDVDIAVLDGGVQPDHPDLSVAGGVNCVNDGDSWADRDGHGTMVAGHAAALDNDHGIVGVAPGARVWGVRIAQPDGVIMESAALCGLEWVNEHAGTIEVANLSWGAQGTASTDCGDMPAAEVTKAARKRENNGKGKGKGKGRNSDGAQVDPVAEAAIHRLICGAVEAGVTVIAAAGNDDADAATQVPAAYPEVIAVSALADTDGMPGGDGHTAWCLPGEQDDTLAKFSNWGEAVDIAAPGVCTLSTTVNDSYAFGSGTSYAAPLVAGAAALVAAAAPDASPAQVRAELLDSAEPGPLRRDRDGHPEGVVNVAGL